MTRRALLGRRVERRKVGEWPTKVIQKPWMTNSSDAHTNNTFGRLWTVANRSYSSGVRVPVIQVHSLSNVNVNH